MSRDESRDAGRSRWHVAQAVLGLLVTCAIVFGPVSSAAADINRPSVAAANAFARGNVLYDSATLAGVYEPAPGTYTGFLLFSAFGPMT